jgi:hypothetical protein
LAARNMTQAKRPLRTELATDKAKPKSSWAKGWGSKKRCTDTATMPMAATMIKMPSKPDEKYSALWWP